MSGVDQDIVAVGLDLKPENLILAYSNGVFPWPAPDVPLLWYCPRRRAILNFKSFHLSKRLTQYLKKSNWTFTLNRAFNDVIEACSVRGEEGTWITDEMKSAYKKLHSLGHAHSVEVWETSSSGSAPKLIGGLYGVDVAGTFAGESMFHAKDNASKAAVIFLVFLLQTLGRTFLDIQVLTPHMEAFGAQEIARGKFLKLLQETQGRDFHEFKELDSKKTWTIEDLIRTGNSLA